MRLIMQNEEAIKEIEKIQKPEETKTTRKQKAKNGMTKEERLTAILYQFVDLYERLTEDSQIAAKQREETAHLVSVFKEEVNRFKELEQAVREEIISSIQSNTTKAVKTISEEIGKEATKEVQETSKQLKNEIWEAQRLLNAYQREIIRAQWKTILVAIFTTVLTCFLVVWLLMPKATLPLTSNQIHDLYKGEMMTLIWSKLSKEEKEDWQKFTEEVEHPEQLSLPRLPTEDDS
jgi:hypothetical protein